MLDSSSSLQSIRHAINDASRVRLEELLLQIWRVMADSRPLIANAVRRAIVESGDRKLRASDLCCNCDEDYFVEENYAGSCVHHECESNVPLGAAKCMRCPSGR